MNNETPRYAVVHYKVRRELDVSFNEYIYLDMVHKLSYERWCIKSLDECAKDIGITRRGMMKMKNRMLEKGYLRKNSLGHLKVTDAYIKVAVLEKSEVGNSVPKLGNSVPQTRELSSPKNNNRNTLENSNENEKSGKTVDNTDHRGEHSPAKERLREMFQHKKLEQVSLIGG